MHQKVAHLTHAQVVGSIPRHTGGNAHLSLPLSPLPLPLPLSIKSILKNFNWQGKRRHWHGDMVHLSKPPASTTTLF